MGMKERYENAKLRLLSDSEIDAANRKLFKEFFDFEEYKLKRTNRLPRLDDGCCRTLLAYISRFRNVNAWFGNKPWKNLTKAEIRRVYDGLEDGTILNRRGIPVADRASYYNKIMRSKPFRMAGKAELARDVLEYYSGKEDDEVRFVTEDDFRKLVSVVSKPEHLLLFWLHWDIGENINTLLQLTPKELTRQVNPYTHEAEYLVNLPREKIKRSRLSRSEPTLHPETVKFIDIVLHGKQRDEPLFGFGHRQAMKVMTSAVKRSGAKCLPHGDGITWKDLRSGMACYLLSKGWSRDEVNARLGHAPSSRTLDRYINYLAIDRHKPKGKLTATTLQEVKNQLEEARQREKLAGERLERQGAELEAMRKKVEALRQVVEQVGAASGSPMKPRSR